MSVARRMATARHASFARVEKIGMTLPRVALGTMYGSPALKLQGQLIACLATHKSAEPNTLVVRIDYTDREMRVGHEPDIYYLKPHYVDYPCVLARLDRISDAALRELLESSWEFVAKSRHTEPKPRRSHRVK
ncbi:MAG TPA: hypothetical protein VJ867_11970 [Gemmatimonadaceae bacterium]|nr:hypothetical protein [Gemmatimonadaceae bacterium]